MCPRSWNGLLLACYMLGLSGYNMENMTANHSGPPWWERCHVPRTLKNPAVVFDGSGNLWAPPQEARLPDLTHPSFFLVAIGVCRPYCPCVPFRFSFHRHFMFISSSVSCSSSEYSWNIAARTLNPNNQSINQSIFFGFSTNQKSPKQFYAGYPKKHSY